MGHLLIKLSLLAQPVGLCCHQATSYLFNGVPLAEELQLGGSTFIFELLVPLENLDLQLQIVLQHLQLLGVDLERALLLLVLKNQLFLFELDCFLQAEPTFLGGLGVELHQHLPCFHRIALFNKNLVDHTPHRHLDVLHRVDRFELAGGDNDFFGARQRKPGHAEDRGTDQRPGDGAHPETTLLQHRFVVGIEIGGRFGSSRIETVQEIAGFGNQIARGLLNKGGQLLLGGHHRQELSCWR